MSKEQTVFTKTSYGGRAWLCVSCADKNGISTESVGVETPIVESEDK
jgi:hypothetical protein